MPKIEYKCAYCNKPIYLYQSQTKGKKLIHCSQKCYHLNRSKQMIGGSYKSTLIPDSKLIDDLQSLARKLGKLPNSIDINTEWSGRAVKYYRRFGSIENAIKATGSSIDEYLLSDIKRVSKKINRTPTDVDYREHGRFSVQRFWTRFKSWSKACELAGLKPHTTTEGGYYVVEAYEYTRKHDDKKIILTGTYELRFAQKCDMLGIEWLCHGEYDPIIYTDTRDSRNMIRRYFPDFYLPHIKTFIETKGWYRERDKSKMELVMSQNPTVIIIIVGQHELLHFEKTGALP